VGCTDVGTTLTLTGASNFSAPTGGDYEFATLSSAGLNEIVKITARTGSVLTVVRGQESTAALVWLSGTLIEGRVTKAGLTRFVQNTAVGQGVAISFAGTAAVSGSAAIAIGAGATATADNGIIVGTGGQNQGAKAIAIGYATHVRSDYS